MYSRFVSSNVKFELLNIQKPRNCNKSVKYDY